LEDAPFDRARPPHASTPRRAAPPPPACLTARGPSGPRCHGGSPPEAAAPAPLPARRPARLHAAGAPASAPPIAARRRPNGHAAGEVASEMAVRFVARELGSLKSLSDDQVADRMRTAIRAANGAIFQRTLTEHDKRGMGTTVTAVVLYDTRFLIGQVGDSRAYLYRDQKLMQLTKDHSYVQEQVDAGYLTPEQARSHPYSNVITRC